MARRRRLVILLTILIAFIFAGIAWAALGPRTHWMGHVYIVAVEVSEPGDYRLLLPSPIDEEGQPSPAMNSPIITNGTAIWSIEDTPYGYALNLSGAGNVGIEWGFRRQVTGQPPPLDLNRRHPNGDVDFSMWAENDSDTRDYDLGKVWVFAHRENQNQELTVTVFLRIQDARHIASFQVQHDGWMAVPVSSYAHAP